MIRLETEFLFHFRGRGMLAITFTLLLPDVLFALCMAKSGDVNGQAQSSVELCAGVQLMQMKSFVLNILRAKEEYLRD